MKKSLKLLVCILTLGVMASASSLLAQDQKAPPADGGGKKGGGRGGRGPTVEAIETAVGTLTADQKTKIGALITKNQEAMAAIAQEDRQTKGPELRAALNKDIRALLTADQQAKFDAMPQGGRGGGGKKKNQ